MTDWRRDAAVCAVLVLGALAYVASWPHDFYGFDEGMYLYEAKRILDGDVMYRDFFQIITPAWFYLMAACYALFGISIETARGTMVVVHAAIVGCIFWAGRLVGLPRSIAALLALLHLTLGYPASAIATPHWVSTLLYLIIALVVLRAPSATPLRAAGWGALVGILILVQQQKGTIMAAGVGLIVALDARGHASPFRMLSRHVAAYLGAMGAVVAPVMLMFVAVAGFDNVWNPLVRYPVQNYPRIHQNIPWGFYIPGIVPVGFVIRCLPAVIPIAAAVTVWRIYRNRSDPQRKLAALLVLSGFAFLSVLYNPNHFHFALAAPLWFLLAGAVLAPYLSGSPRVIRVASNAALLLIVACVVQLVLTLGARRAGLPSSTLTPFGRIDTQNIEHGKVIQQLDALLHDQAGVDVFVYPANPGLYLVAGLRNPTRYQIVLPSYTALREQEEIIASLEERQVEYVVSHLYPGLGELGPLNRYIRERYELLANVGGNVVYRRRRSPLPRATF